MSVLKEILLNWTWLVSNPGPLCVCVCVHSPETALSLAVQCEPGGGESIRVLVDGGAHIDFRAKDGLTPLHKAVRGHRHTALLVKTYTLS